MQIGSFTRNTALTQWRCGVIAPMFSGYLIATQLLSPLAPPHSRAERQELPRATLSASTAPSAAFHVERTGSMMSTAQQCVPAGAYSRVRRKAALLSHLRKSDQSITPTRIRYELHVKPLLRHRLTAHHSASVMMCGRTKSQNRADGCSSAVGVRVRVITGTTHLTKAFMTVASASRQQRTRRRENAQLLVFHAKRPARCEGVGAMRWRQRSFSGERGAAQALVSRETSPHLHRSAATEPGASLRGPHAHPRCGDGESAHRSPARPRSPRVRDRARPTPDDMALLGSLHGGRISSALRRERREGSCDSPRRQPNVHSVVHIGGQRCG